MSNIARIVDTHVHLWDLDSHSYPWLSVPFEHETFHGDISQIRRNYLLEDFKTDTAECPVVGMVHLQAEIESSDPVRETAWLQSLADREGMPQGIVGFAALHDPDVEKVLEAHAQHANHRGIRHIISWHEDPFFGQCERADFMMSEDWRAGYRLLRKFDMSFDLQAYPSQLSDAVELGRGFPDTLLILEHCGFPAQKDPESIAHWRRGMRSMAALPNTALKISALVMFDHAWTRESLIPLIREATEIFGPRRTMFASDFPVDGLYIGYSEWVSVFAEAIGDMSDDEKDAVFAGNAVDLYRLRLSC